MAETSLSRQLKKLSVPQTTILIQDKIRKSFLFDHRDAAGLDRELIFALGNTGLQKLSLINSSFSNFEGNLFSRSIIDYERSVLSSNVNRKLDERIVDFLRNLSPYFLLREAHEALEWLVYRFHVHLYNVDDLIACALPHYNTGYFVRVVQLIDLDANSRWLWLKPVQKTGVPLDYSAILNRFLSDAGFRKFVCDIAVNVLNAYNGCENSAVPSCSFSMLTIRNALGKCKLIDDKLLLSLLPYVLSGLSSNLNDYIIGSYLVIAEILSKVKLNTDVLNEILIKIFELYKEDLNEEIVTILILIFQTQPIEVIPQKVYLFLISNDKIWKILIKSLNSFKATSLTKAVIKMSLRVLFNVSFNVSSKTWKKSVKVFQQIISHVVLEEKCVLFTFNCILKKYCKAFRKHSNKNLKNLKKIVKYAVKNFEHKYPDHFDKAYKKFLEKNHKNKKMLRKLVSNYVSCVKYNVVPEIITPLTLDPYYPNPSVRETEIQTKTPVLSQFLSDNESLLTVDNESTLTSCIPILYNYLSLLNEVGSDYEPILEIIHLLLKKFTAKTAVCLTENSDVSKAFLYSLTLTVSDENDIGKQVQLMVLDVITKEFFSLIPSVAVQQEILVQLVSLYMSSPANISANVEKVLRQVLDHAYLFLKHVKDQVIPVSESATLREMKKVKIESCLNNLESEVWKKIVVFLELIQSESSFVHKEILLPGLFDLLNKSLDFDSQHLSEYIRQLILSAIHNCCEQFGSRKHLEQYFQVELIVQCMRSSANPKTHRHALLLLNLAAALFPDSVLKNVMSIFVFMGSSLIRQDNSYSFQVISQTIETVLPSLCEASYQQTKTDRDQVVASVIRVFVDSLLDIPGHRQLPLFTKLINTLEPSKYLWIPLSQICDQYATDFHNISSDDAKSQKVSPALEFAVNLHNQFPPDIQMDTCIKLIEFLLMLPDSKKQFDQNPKRYEEIKEPFNVASHNDNELQIYKYTVLCYMKMWLSSQAFHSQVSELNAREQRSLEEKYERLLQSVLLVLKDRLSSKKNVKDCKNLNDQLQLLYDIVYAINSLLPQNLFIRVIRRLLKNEEKEIQLRAVELLSLKLEQQEDLFKAENHHLLLKLLKPLLKIANTSVKVKDDNQYLDIKQTALYALHLLCKLIGSEYPGKFYRVLNLAVTILDDCSQPELVVSALLCLAQLCHCLNVDILPRLNTFMPPIIKILQDDKILDTSEYFVLGIATALHSIIENLGMFLSSYMEDIISSICICSVKCSKLGKRTEKFEKLQAKLANEVPLRILLPAIESSYLKLSQTNIAVIIPLMKMLTLNLNSSNYEDILSCVSQLQNLYMSLLDFRNRNLQLPLKIVDLIEDSIISSLRVFVLKLSVTRFRTFFQKLYQWAVVTKDDQEQKCRVFSFYKLTCEFSKSLKSLFSPMCKYLFRHISSTLDSCNVSKGNDSYFDCKNLWNELLINVIDTLNFCFVYAEEQLLDKENFDQLLFPVVDQLENLCDREVYQNLVENHLSSCIAHFMNAVSDNALWKSLNYQILLKTRHVSPSVRFAALRVILEVVKKMGDNYLVLLPESIPFLAEIMEDESSDVERECKIVIVEMEKILGEPIQKYF